MSATEMPGLFRSSGWIRSYCAAMVLLMASPLAICLSNITSNEIKLAKVVRNDSELFEITCIREHDAYCVDRPDNYSFSDGCRYCKCLGRKSYCQGEQCVIFHFADVDPIAYCAVLLDQNDHQPSAMNVVDEQLLHSASLMIQGSYGKFDETSDQPLNNIFNKTSSSGAFKPRHKYTTGDYTKLTRKPVGAAPQVLKRFIRYNTVDISDMAKNPVRSQTHQTTMLPFISSPSNASLVGGENKVNVSSVKSTVNADYTHENLTQISKVPVGDGNDEVHQAKTQILETMSTDKAPVTMTISALAHASVDDDGDIITELMETFGEIAKPLKIDALSGSGSIFDLKNDTLLNENSLHQTIESNITENESALQDLDDFTTFKVYPLKENASNSGDEVKATDTVGETIVIKSVSKVDGDKSGHQKRRRSMTHHGNMKIVPSTQNSISMSTEDPEDLPVRLLTMKVKSLSDKLLALNNHLKICRAYRKVMREVIQKRVTKPEQYGNHTSSSSGKHLGFASMTIPILTWYIVVTH